jgi:Periplasmic copper-binding protein (NosD)
VPTLSSFARHLICCVLLLTLIPLNNSAYAEWKWSLPFSSGSFATAPDNEPAVTEKPENPEVNHTSLAPKDSSPQCPTDNSTLQPPSSALTQKAPPELIVLPAIQGAATISRPLASFSPSTRLGTVILEEDTQWSGALLIEGMVTISPQTTLTVMPDSTIRFGADSGLLVYGRIAVKGTPESPVFISSLYEAPRPSDWNGIFLIGTEKNNLFDHLVIQGADTAIQASFSTFEANGIRVGNSSTGLKLSNSTVTVKNSSISASSYGILSLKSEVDLESATFDKNRNAMSLQSSSLTAVNVKLRDNTHTALIAEKSQLKLDRVLFSSNLNGLKSTGCDGSIMNSSFISNTETAASLTESNLKFSENHISGSRVGLHLDDNSPAIWRNSISGNSRYDVLYLGEEQLFAGGNWLGQSISGNGELSVFSKRRGALLTAPLLTIDPYPAVKFDSTKATD